MGKYNLTNQQIQEITISVDRKKIMNDEKCVHTRHCCVLHGCKYGEEDLCPVVNDNKKQEYTCEECDWEGIMSVSEVRNIYKEQKEPEKIVSKFGPEEIEKAVEYLKEYINTYENQVKWKSYSIETFLDDMVYGIGVSLDKKYEWADGYKIFKKKLVKFLTGK